MYRTILQGLEDRSVHHREGGENSSPSKRPYSDPVGATVEQPSRLLKYVLMACAEIFERIERAIGNVSEVARGQSPPIRASLRDETSTSAAC